MWKRRVHVGLDVRDFSPLVSPTSTAHSRNWLSGLKALCPLSVGHYLLHELRYKRPKSEKRMILTDSSIVRNIPAHVLVHSIRLSR